MNCHSCGTHILREYREDIDELDPRGHRDIGAVYHCPFCGWSARFEVVRQRWRQITEGRCVDLRVERRCWDEVGHGRPLTADEREWDETERHGYDRLPIRGA